MPICNQNDFIKCCLLSDAHHELCYICYNFKSQNTQMPYFFICWLNSESNPTAMHRWSLCVKIITMIINVISRYSSYKLTTGSFLIKC